MVSAVLWSLVVFMATDHHCKTNEKRSLRFLSALAVASTAIAIWTFQPNQLRAVPLQDWALLGLLPFILINLKYRSQLIKLQSEAVGRTCTIPELNLSKIPDSGIVKKFKIFNAVTWVFIAITFTVLIWSRSIESI